MREDLEDQTQGTDKCRFVDIWRHEAVIDGLIPGQSSLYRVVSVNSSGNEIRSDSFPCSCIPTSGTGLKILLTSDHHLKQLVAANLQKVKEVCTKIDVIFMAGDCVNYPDRASEWFGGNGIDGAFFPCLQGKANKTIHGKTYQGAPLLQSAPLYCAVGNHEIMGRFDKKKTIAEQFNDSYPSIEAEKVYAKLYPSVDDPVHKSAWLKGHSFNYGSYQEVFSLPRSARGGSKYYAVTYGDIRLIVLCAARVWRFPELGIKGKFTEATDSLNDSLKWGYGDFILEPIEKGSEQYQWLEEEVNSKDFKEAKFKIVMLHNPFHTIEENATPPFAHPVQSIQRDKNNTITSIRYSYPITEDILIRDVEPLLLEKGVNLIFCGHSHLWNRFQAPSGTHYLESSNVGNTNGVYANIKRSVIPADEVDSSDYIATGDPYGLQPIMSTLSPLKDAEGNSLPYISSNDITAFSILDTQSGAVDSYYFDARQPDSPVVHFDQFFLQ